MKKFYLACLTLAAINSYAGQDYVTGTISNLTATQYGIMIMIDADRKVPDNCIGTPYNWMLISEENKAMIGVVLTAWTIGRNVTVYSATY